MIFSTLTLLVEETPHDGPLNMAIDEVLAREAVTPLLRIYRWADAAVSFGYFGEYTDVAERWPARTLVRRWTGGGEVSHGDDFTYTLVVPRNESFSRVPVRESYRRIHELLASVMPGTSLADSDAAANAACFARPVVADVMKDGAKIAGAAQRRGSFGLLHQGSLQGTDWPATLAEDFAKSLAPVWERGSLASESLREASVLAYEKYGTDEWLRRR